MAKAVYDDIAEEYKASKQLPFRIYVERYTLFQLMGDLKDKTVLDLACGEGIYNRIIMNKGAKKSIGVDISSEMIALAEAEEKKHPTGAEYVVQDAGHYQADTLVDIVMCSYLLNYAKTWNEIFTFTKAIYNNLKPGGRFVAFNDNIKGAPEHYSIYKKYGFYKSTLPNRKEGDPITYHFINADGSEFQFDNFYLTKETYERAFKEAGFKNFQWHIPQLSKEGLEKFGKEYWADFLEYPPMIAMTAEK